MDYKFWSKIQTVRGAGRTGPRTSRYKDENRPGPHTAARYPPNAREAGGEHAESKSYG